MRAYQLITSVLETRTREDHVLTASGHDTPLSPLCGAVFVLSIKIVFLPSRCMRDIRAISLTVLYCFPHLIPYLTQLQSRDFPRPLPRCFV